MRGTITAAAIFLFAILSSAVYGAGEGCRDLSGAPMRARVDLCKKVNIVRRDRGLGDVSLVTALTRIAQSFADDMITRNYFSHYSPEGHDLGWRLETVDYSSLAGENIAWGFDTASGTVAGWMRSDGHRKNLLQPKFTKMGVGYNDKIWVQILTD